MSHPDPHPDSHDDRTAPPRASHASNDIAIIGMACHFPGATSPDAFWQLLRDGREARRALSDEELRAAGVDERLLANPAYVKSGMFLADMEHFDHAFFGFSPLDGRILDPQHRHFLECSWEALEDAGYDPHRYDGSIGVFAGAGQHLYLHQHLLSNPGLVADVGPFLLRHTGNDKDFLATRVSYCLDLQGPSVSVQTACSTSLVAMHYAAQSLLGGECDMALAGGVTIELPHGQGYLWRDGEILSPDGHCRPFDASAAGTVFGSGAGVVVLKRLEHALADGDRVLAVLKGSAVNNDGAGKVSYLAPSVDGQAAVIREALAVGEIAPASVSYVEAHGTGTPLGDPIEVAALNEAYGAGRRGGGGCAIGSVKSNIGHLDTAAGIASVIKVVAALRARELPPTLHFGAPNPAIDFAAGPFRVNDRLTAWEEGRPRRAGVSSLGVGGTNAHVVLEEAPEPRPAGPARALQLLTLSARTPAARDRARGRLVEALEGGDDGDTAATHLADVAFTLAQGRHPFRQRAAVVATDTATAVAALDGSTDGRLLLGEAPAAERRVAFMFAGGGAQYPGMGSGLYATEPVYRECVDHCLTLVREWTTIDLRPFLLPGAGDGRDGAELARELERPSRTLPALFITQYAQAQLWRSWGVSPSALLGHSMGEYTAATLAGVMTLRDALGLVSTRGRLFEAVAPGGMLGVELDERSLAPRLGSELSIAAVNAPGLSVASGPDETLRALEKALTAEGISCSRVRINVAAHSPMLDPILEEFRRFVRTIPLRAPTIPIASNVTGAWLTAADAADPEYWVRHLRHTVRFADDVATILADDEYLLLEVGPGRTLASLASRHPSLRSRQHVMTSLRNPDEATPDLEHMLTALGRAWVQGAAVDWGAFYSGQRRRRVALPTYPFERVRCWVDPLSSAPNTPTSDAGRSEDGGAVALVHEPTWRRLPDAPDATFQGARVLVMGTAGAPCAPLAARLRATGGDVRVAQLDDSPPLDGAATLCVRPREGDDYFRLVEVLEGEGWRPTHVVHLTAFDTDRMRTTRDPATARALAFDSLRHLAQGAGREDWRDVHWLVVTTDAQQVAGEPVRSPYPGLALGALRVLPAEFPGWRAGLVDIESHAAQSMPDELARRIASELGALARSTDGGEGAARVSEIALRGRLRFARRFEPLPANDDSAALAASFVHPEGVYLVTGGTGGLGGVAAEVVASRCAPGAIVVLLARHPLPERVHWGALIDSGAPETPLLQRIQSLEAGGVRVRVEGGDVADRAAMLRLRDALQRERGPVRGIVHAAGVLDDAPLLARELERAEPVLRSKVAGTLVLDEVFGDSLDFFVLYSSTSAFAGLPGQFDYAAANAFLDAFATMRHAQGARVVSVNWPAWRGTGMAAARARGATRDRLPAGHPLPHPLLHRCVASLPTAATFASRFEVARDWVVREHRLADGPALLPGAGFMEVACAAFEAMHPAGAPAGSVGGGRAIELRDATFELPFIVHDDDARLLTATLSGARDGCDVVLTSEADGETITHARSRVREVAPIVQSLDVAAIVARCAAGVQRFDDPDHHPFLQFGPRWASLRQVRLGASEAVIELELPEQFVNELADFRLHPALLDMASAGAQAIIPGYRPREEFYVPVGYRRLVANAPFPRRAFSHVRYRPPADAAHSREIAHLDVTVCDESGRVFLAIEGFSMRRLADAAPLRARPNGRTAASDAALARALELGIDPAAGAQVLRRVLALDAPPRVIVSPVAVDRLVASLHAGTPAAKTAARAVPAHDPDADPDIAQVEATLSTSPAVRLVAVRSYPEGRTGRRFVAWFLPDDDHYRTLGDVRRFARTTLAPELVPHHFVELDAMSLGADGGIDRSPLVDPLAPRDSYRAPRTTTERALATLWADALGIERVGLSDNFFDLGGHSLLSIRVILQTERRLGVRLDPATIVLSTLEQVAHELDRRRQASDAVSAGKDATAEAERAETPPASTGDAGRDTSDRNESGGLLRFFRGRTTEKA